MCALLGLETDVIFLCSWTEKTLRDVSCVWKDWRGMETGQVKTRLSLPDAGLDPEENCFCSVAMMFVLKVKALGWR